MSVRRPRNILTFHDHTGHTSWKYMYKNIKIIINCILRFNIWSIWVHICTKIQDPMTRAISGLPSTSHIHSLVTLRLPKRSFLKRKFLTQCPCYLISTSPVISLFSCKIRTNPEVNIDLKLFMSVQVTYFLIYNTFCSPGDRTATCGVG